MVVVIIISTAWTKISSSPVIASDSKTKIATAVDPQFSFFRLHRQGKNGVTATWGLTSNVGVSGFMLEKTYEDPNDEYANWELVVSVPGSGLRSYKHTDSNVSPGFITYRLTAFISGARSIVSENATIHIVSH